MSLSKTFRYTVIYFCIALSSLSAQQDSADNKVQRSTFHLIVLADTLDDFIGEDVQKDVKNIVKEAKNISTYAGMKLKTIVIQGENANYNYTSQMIKKLKFNANDAVFFYFSGHGYRTEDKGTNPWPDLSLVSSEEMGIDFSLIVEQLIRKQPRFILAIADSCNSFLDEEGADVTYRKSRKTNGKLELKNKNYQKLFLYSKGLVIASAAAPGEYGISLQVGGLYTLAFLDSLSKETSQENDETSWEVLMQRTLEKAVNTSTYTYEIDGEKFSYLMTSEPFSQWLRVEDITDVEGALRAIGR